MQHDYVFEVGSQESRYATAVDIKQDLDAIKPEIEQTQKFRESLRFKDLKHVKTKLNSHGLSSHQTRTRDYLQNIKIQTKN